MSTYRQATTPRSSCPSCDCGRFEIFHKLSAETAGEMNVPAQEIDPAVLDIIEAGVMAGISALGNWITDNDMCICKEL